MPELPEVETTVRGLARHLDGERIERVALNRPDMRFPFPDGMVQALTGARVTGLDRRAKYGLIHTDRATTMVFHLGMSGRWRIDPADAARHDHLVIDTAALEAWPAFAVMGPEPLGPGLSAAHLLGVLKGRKPAIKLMLLDQRVVAGLGNIYVCEALFRARIDPRKPAGKVARPALERLIPTIRAVLEQSIGDGGSSLRDYARPDGELGYFASRFDVYGREGEPCRPPCPGTVKRIVQSGRSTWFCPKCQK